MIQEASEICDCDRGGVVKIENSNVHQNDAIENIDKI
jgi:hypothetical protein